MRFFLLCLLSAANCLFPEASKCQSMIDRMPSTEQGVTTLLFSSYDPAGGNADGNLDGNYLYNFPGTEGREYVMAEIYGRGEVKRFWNARYDSSAVVRYYVDGESVPSIELSVNEIFYQHRPPFREAYTYDFSRNSGAYVTYQPIPFEKSLKVTIDRPVGYYQLQIDRFEEVETPDPPADDLADELEALLESDWEASDTWEADSLFGNLAKGSDPLLMQKTGMKMVRSIELKLPDLDPANDSRMIEDDGRISSTGSRFFVRINRGASQYRIRLRHNVRTGPTEALVVAGNTSVGTWKIDEPIDIQSKWKDFEFVITGDEMPDADSVRLSFVTTTHKDWCDFYYWVYSDDILTDSVNIGLAADEARSRYENFNETYYVTFLGHYGRDRELASRNGNILKNLWIDVFIDDQEMISAPAGMFFGLGVLDAPLTNSLLWGYDGIHLYNRLPMPFWSEFKLQLRNEGEIDLKNLQLRILYADHQLDKRENGYLKAEYTMAGTLAGEGDLRILDVTGSGQICGMVLNGNSPDIRWLEGDDRVFTERMRSPLIYGTGTEDIFNGGDYFLLGQRSLPLFGMNYQDSTYVNMYRNFISDPIRFNEQITYSLERGADNAFDVEYNVLVFYYINEEKVYCDRHSQISVSGSATGSDSLRYEAFGGIPFEKTSAFEGYDFPVPETFSGLAGPDSSSIWLQISPDNGGIRLIRLLDYSVPNQCAQVMVDGEPVGLWCTQGNNPYMQWREDVFHIPADLSSGKESLEIKLKPLGPWTEVYYRICERRPVGAVTAEEMRDVMIPLHIYPNPSHGLFKIRLAPAMLNACKAIHVTDVLGRILLRLPGTDVQVDLSGMSQGVYHLILIGTKGEYLGSEKLVKVN